MVKKSINLRILGRILVVIVIEVLNRLLDQMPSLYAHISSNTRMEKEGGKDTNKYLRVQIQRVSEVLYGIPLILQELV